MGMKNTIINIPGIKNQLMKVFLLGNSDQINNRNIANKLKTDMDLKRKENMRKMGHFLMNKMIELYSNSDICWSIINL